jgi:hypothetical protein
MPSSSQFFCPCCGKMTKTDQGLRTHTALSPKCRDFVAHARQNTANTTISAQTTVPSPQKRPLSPLETVIPTPSKPSPLRSFNAPSPTPSKRPRPTVEDVPDEGDPLCQPHLYSGGATYAEWFPTRVATTYGEGLNSFEKRQQQQEEEDLTPFAPFEDHAEWELASLLMKSEISKAAVDDLLKLEIVRYSIWCLG